MPVIAVDWSGAANPSDAARRIWVAEAVGGELVRLENGRSREQVLAWLLAEGRRSPDLVVGLDFAFGFPAWFAHEQGVADGPALWAHARSAGERWLHECAPPFWGRPGRRRTLDPSRLWRRTEQEVPRIAGVAPKSVFQVGGAGAVGTGSIRGMPLLARLHEAGWRVWPFTDGDGPTVVEIYPRLLTGAVTKSSFSQRAELLRHRFPSLGAEQGVIASSSDDAFDAAVSALVMATHADSLAALRPARDEVERVEGAIWWPDRSGE